MASTENETHPHIKDFTDSMINTLASSFLRYYYGALTELNFEVVRACYHKQACLKHFDKNDEFNELNGRKQIGDFLQRMYHENPAISIEIDSVNSSKGHLEDANDDKFDETVAGVAIIGSIKYELQTYRFAQQLTLSQHPEKTQRFYISTEIFNFLLPVPIPANAGKISIFGF